MYMAEAATEELRGTLGASNQLFIATGTMAVYIAGLLLVAPAPGPPSTLALWGRDAHVLWQAAGASPALTSSVLPPTLVASTPDTVLGLAGWRVLALAGEPVCSCACEPLT